MLFLLSPAKSLDYETPAAGVPHTLPQFVPQSQALIDVLRQKSPQQIAELMDLSDALSALNVARYEGLDAKTLSAQDLDWAQTHVGILSGLYGVLRPLDWMQPYRLEMGTTLQTDKGSNLYKFWGPQIAEYLNAQLAKDKTPVIVNLASQEYFKSVDRKTLKARVIECVFEDFKGGKYKIISFNAKRARGLMARFAIQNKITHPEGLLGFDLEGYAYDPQVSEPDRLVFRRKVQA
jgi:cytoplasmic iron level regulating protein YaaA (DUF328/UPF0246 family)